MIEIPEGFKVEDCSIQKLSVIETRDQDGTLNGSLFNIVNPNLLDVLPIGQVYMTICEPSKIKGPHMHFAPKTDRFFCVRGVVEIICRNEQTMKMFHFYLNMFDNLLLTIPPFNSHAIRNLSNSDSMVLSIPTEGYDPNKPYNQIETSF